jgi:hypothetical protein
MLRLLLLSSLIVTAPFLVLGQSQIKLSAGEIDPDWEFSSQQKEINVKPTNQKMATCGTPGVSGGYPAYTNAWAGYQFNLINSSANSIIINTFEARFRGTSGYRIYTKNGTFVGSELNAAAWTLVGSIASGLASVSLTAPTPIPINVNVCIPAGATQAFYLTRTDNLSANRHMYVPGTGTGGTTVYATDGTLSITEAFYITPYFATLYAQVRRPSLDVCYTVAVCSALPVKVVSFDGYSEDDHNYLEWITESEQNNDYFSIERSNDGVTWAEIGTVAGSYNSSSTKNYSYKDFSFEKTINYYRLKQTDFDGKTELFDIIKIDNRMSSTGGIKYYTTDGRTLTKGQANDFFGILIKKYPDGTTNKVVQVKR